MAVILQVLLVSLLALQSQPKEPALAIRILQLLNALMTGDDSQEAAVQAEAHQIFLARGVPTIADVGDEAAYAFVVLTCSTTSSDREVVLSKAKRAASRRALAQDAVDYCEARVRLDAMKARAGRRPPTRPELRDEIQRMVITDQAVRQKADFDPVKMQQVDREHQAALMSIFDTYGVPTYAMVGPEAASGFVTMVQHQPPEFRRRVLPKLKASVDAGQADPALHAMVYDRAARDAGRKQLYGENLECSLENPTLHRGPIEDEAHVNQRRAKVGLIRLEMYERLVVELSPAVCAPGGAK